jgi:regulator of RNase E activity RraA/CMP-N-acetylneuraminic acid synthetase
MSVIAFLPAKGESSRVSNKNQRLLDGEPLFIRNLRKISGMSCIDKVVLDTESDEIIEQASEIDCEIMERDPRLATNETGGNDLLLNEAQNISGDIYVQILATSPFISPESIREGIEKVMKSEHDSAVLVESSPEYLWVDGYPNYDVNNIPDSNVLDKVTKETMGLYVIEHDALMQTERRIGDNPYLIEASSMEAIDIDYEDDFKLADYTARGMREVEEKRLRVLRHILSSAIICDVLNELGYDGFIDSYESNTEMPIFGRAKTLSLRELRQNEDPDQIYQALDSYERIVPGDIIVVENECTEFAYFGELNALLAIREGAQGALIDSHTRDIAETTKLGFPVFAKGTTPNDIKGKGTVADMHKKVKINGTEVRPNDLIFADRDGAVVVPADIEDKVLTRAMEVATQENNVLSGISSETPVSELTEEHGDF